MNTTQWYTINYEFDGRGWYYIHMVMHQWCPRAHRSLQTFFKSVENVDLRVNVHPDDTKLIKFASLYGFHPSYKDTGANGTLFTILEKQNGNTIRRRTV